MRSMGRHLCHSISASDQTWLTLSSIVLQVTTPLPSPTACLHPPFTLSLHLWSIQTGLESFTCTLGSKLTSILSKPERERKRESKRERAHAMARLLRGRERESAFNCCQFTV